MTIGAQSRRYSVARYLVVAVQWTDTFDTGLINIWRGAIWARPGHNFSYIFGRRADEDSRRDRSPKRVRTLPAVVVLVSAVSSSLLLSMSTHLPYSLLVRDYYHPTVRPSDY